MADPHAPVTSADHHPWYQEASAVMRQIAHELRQPLSTIESIGYYLEMILPPADRKALDQVVKLQRLVEEANWIISDAEHFFQACPLRPQLLDLHEVLSKCTAEAGWRERPKVNFVLAESLPLVRMDPGQAEHMIRNLLAFSRQSAPGESAVTVHTLAAEGAVRLEIVTVVADQRLAELEESLASAAGIPGYGAGLAIAAVRRIAEAHGGRIETRRPEAGGLSIRLTFEAAE